MAFDFKKKYKDLYLPGPRPTLIDVPPIPFIIVEGKGNPNTSESYKEAIELLYGLSFTIKMSKMKGEQPEGYFEYAVPPLEGFWWSDDGEPFGLDSVGNKDDYCWYSCIRQPDFVTQEVFENAQAKLRAKKPRLNVSRAVFRTITEGLCAQLMHTGSYDDEPRSIALLHAYIDEQGYELDAGRLHHEIYLGDPRRCAPERLKTVLRQPIRKR